MQHILKSTQAAMMLLCGWAICPTCKRFCRISKTTTGDGWETWTCEYGHVNEYRIVGRPN